MLASLFRYIIVIEICWDHESLKFTKLEVCQCVIQLWCQMTQKVCCNLYVKSDVLYCMMTKKLFFSTAKCTSLIEWISNVCSGC